MRILLRVFFCLLVMGFSSVSQAEDPKVVMEEMVVTATRTAQAVEKIPAQVTVITRDQIEASGAQSVPDALSRLAGVYVSDLNGNGTNQTVDMGGFGETASRHVAVVIDGRKINPLDLSGPRWAAIGMDNIERIEVLSGSGSVLYGDQAMGGVINIITRAPNEGTQVKFEVGGGSLGTQRMTASLNLGAPTTGIVLNAGTNETDGYRDNSASEQENFSAKYAQQFGDRLAGRFQLDHTKAEYAFPGALTAAQMAQNRTQTTTPNDKESDNATTLLTGVELDMGRAGTADMAFSYRKETRNVYMWWTYYDYDMTTLGINAKYVFEEPVAGRDNRFTAGVDYYRDDYARDDGFAPTTRTNHFRHQRNTLAGYIQDELAVMDRLTLNLGFRTEKPDTELRADIGGANTAADKDQSEYAWNLGLAYRFMDRSKIYARAYRSFRYPVVDEYTWWNGTINNQLEPEVSTGYEAGIKAKVFDAVEASVRTFLFDVVDEIMINALFTQNENIGETRHKGAELSLRYTPIASVTLFGSTAYTDAEFTEAVNANNNGNTVPLVPEWKSHAGIDLLCPLGFRSRIQYNYVGERYEGGDYANTQPKMASYETVDVYLTYPLKQAEFFVNATNVFNEQYTASGWSGSYYPMPEAVYYGGIRFNF